MMGMNPPIILLKEGTDTSQGKGQLISNINACQAIVETIRSTLGPRGMDKLVVDNRGKVTISNDGATIMKLLDIVHPAGKTLVDIAQSQDAEVGDGTTSVVLLAGELLKECKAYVEEGVHPQVIARSYRLAANLAVQRIKEIAVKFSKATPAEWRSQLMKCAATSMSSKLVNTHRDFFTAMVVDAVLQLDQDTLPIDMIGIKKVQGGSHEESLLVQGVAFKKSFSYAGFEMQPKKYTNPKVALLNIELELKAERDNAEIRVDNVEDYQSVVDAEWTILYNKLDKIVQSGAKVVLSKLPIGDVATQYFADRDVFCAGRVAEDDLRRTQKACAGSVQTSVNNLEGNLGQCGLFEEKQIGGERYNIFSQCPNGNTVTLVLRGGAEQFIEETERSLHDAIMIVRRAIKNDTVVAGGGAIEMELSRYLREYSKTIAGRQQLLIGAFAKAMEIIPRQLCENAGFDSTNVLNKLRHKHYTGGMWYGVDIHNEDISDNMEAFVWEPAMMKINALTAASEAACMILSVDETIKNPGSQQQQGGMGRGRGRPM
eukprot:comp21884_c0_seq1/m.31329 comp21884_c0_seq1/g.31329  ORF comp21884_c0_seq1/g.31329 comp21884_c0_seq1/m.31329 type:complete len:543 (-) comp21884_c0_seq1:405-2033(-)